MMSLHTSHPTSRPRKTWAGQSATARPNRPCHGLTAAAVKAIAVRRHFHQRGLLAIRTRHHDLVALALHMAQRHPHILLPPTKPPTDRTAIASPPFSGTTTSSIIPIFSL